MATARRLAVVGGGAAAVNTLFFTFFLLYSLLLLPLYTFLHPKSPNTNPRLLDLKKTKGKKVRKKTTFESWLDSDLLLFSSREFVLLGPLVDLGFILADSCFGPVRSGCTVCVWFEICC